MSAGATRKPVSSASSRAAASASRSPSRTWPPTVNHHRGAGPSSDRRIRTAQQQHRAGVVEQHHPRRRAVVEARRDRCAPARAGARRSRNSLAAPLFRRDERRAPGAARPARGCPGPRRCGIGGPAAPGLRRRPTRRSVPPAATPDRPPPARPRARFPRVSRACRGARSAASASAANRRPCAATAVGVDRDRPRHHRAARQRAVQRLPGQVVADVQPVQPVGGAVSPRCRPAPSTAAPRSAMAATTSHVISWPPELWRPTRRPSRRPA